MAAAEETLAVVIDMTDTTLIDCSAQQDRGVVKKVLRDGVGTGRPSEGANVTVHYVGRFLDGKVFDSSRRRSEPFSFQLGRGKVIKGWDEGVATMRRGELCELICTSEYAYGKQGSGSIPPYSTLVFQVELLDWQNEDISEAKDGSILRQRLTKGTGYQSPNEGALCKVHVIGRYEDRVFDDRNLEFALGEGAVQSLPSGVECALLKFKKSETAILTLKPKEAFGSDGHTAFGVPSDATLDYEVTLTDFEKTKEIWSLRVPEKLVEAERLKEKGNEYFKKNDYKLALKMYERMKKYLETDPEYKGEDEESRKRSRITAHLNIAMTLIKLREFFAARKECDEALTIDPKNIKGLYRRGTALMSMNEYEEAVKDFQVLLELDSSNKDARDKMASARQQIKEQKDSDRKKFAGMFDKMAKRSEISS